MWKCRSSRQGKDFLTCIKCTRDCLSNLHNPNQISRGGPFLPEKWVLGDHFSTENFGPGDQNLQDQNSGDSAQLVQMVTREVLHHENFNRHRLLHQGLLQQKWYLFLYSSFKQLNSHKIQYYITVLWECQTSTASRKFCRVCGGRMQKKPKTGDQCINTTHTRKHYWLLMAWMLLQMTHPSIHNTSVTRAMQQGDVKAAVPIGVHVLHWVYEWKNIYREGCTVNSVI